MTCLYNSSKLEYRQKLSGSQQGKIMIGIISAMPEELHHIKQAMYIDKTKTIANRDFFIGSLFDQKVVLVLSKIGKVAASITTTLLATHFDIENIIMIGVAGSASKNVKIGDIVIADYLFQHDMDCSPIFPKFEIPLLSKTYFSSCEKLTAQLKNAAKKYWHTDNNINNHVKVFGIENKKIHVGTIVSGDQFIKDSQYAKKLNTEHAAPSPLLAFEMEGAAIAQCCHELAIPFAIIRTISDNADHNANIDFPAFIEEVASYYSFGIIKEYLLLQANSVNKIDL
jgi:adenosylhomocysteine nucleosidase